MPTAAPALPARSAPSTSTPAARGPGETQGSSAMDMIQAHLPAACVDLGQDGIPAAAFARS